MQYQCIDEQLETFIEIIKQNKELMATLDYIDSLKLPNYYIAAGAVFQTIWNYYDQKDLNYNIKDIDLVYHNAKNIEVEEDLKYYEKITEYIKEKNYPYEIDVSNEARMHLWKRKHNNKETEPYETTEDAIRKWIATVHAIGIKKENGKIKVYAPYGLTDIFTRTIRPIRHEGNSKEIYDLKVSKWQQRFTNLTIIDY